jgi:hypothetical protein
MSFSMLVHLALNLALAFVIVWAMILSMAVFVVAVVSGRDTARCFKPVRSSTMVSSWIAGWRGEASASLTLLLLLPLLLLLSVLSSWAHVCLPPSFSVYMVEFGRCSLSFLGAVGWSG